MGMFLATLSVRSMHDARSEHILFFKFRNNLKRHLFCVKNMRGPLNAAVVSHCSSRSAGIHRNCSSIRKESDDEEGLVRRLPLRRAQQLSTLAPAIYTPQYCVGVSATRPPDRLGEEATTMFGDVQPLDAFRVTRTPTRTTAALSHHANGHTTYTPILVDDTHRRRPTSASSVTPWPPAGGVGGRLRLRRQHASQTAFPSTKAARIPESTTTPVVEAGA